MASKKKMGRPRTFEREPTIERALESYWRDGVSSLSVNEICRRAKLSKPALYREFGNEDGLLNAVLEQYFDAVLAPSAALLSSPRSYREITETICEFMTTGISGEQGCLLVKMRDATGRLGPLSTQRVDHVVGELRRAYERFVVACAARGEIRTDLDPTTAARYLDVQVSGGLRMLAAGVPPEEVRALTRVAFDALLPFPSVSSQPTPA